VLVQCSGPTVVYANSSAADGFTATLRWNSDRVDVTYAQKSTATQSTYTFICAGDGPTPAPTATLRP